MAILWGSDLTQIYNDGYREIMADRHPDALGEPVRNTWPASWPAHAPIYESVLAGQSRRISNQEVLIDRDGRLVKAWFDLTCSPLGKAGHVQGVFVVATDQSGRRLSEARWQKGEWRIRNTLAVIRSIARRTAETSESVEDYHMHFEGRIDALARTQAALARNSVDGVALLNIVAEELIAARAREGETFVMAGPEIRLPPDAVGPLGLAVHELATNALKFGALTDRGGKIAIEWSVVGDGERMLDFCWKETGVIIDRPPSRTGFGTELLSRSLAYELRADVTIDFEPDGLRCRIVFPLRETSDG
ncbi:sensor histidine kinase [Jiella avicenniae]|uniref:histidine kinase n=1 Tax=Jiella avicenniae TaxID=2907202 RepID=A0A9X1P3K2_9HYPH|nr:sensor histidine kinase [Jiella avicenniae]MCE7029656.1 sensor histidine kinase [Jiella avicenniae]